MPYKDKEKALAYWKSYYQAHKAGYITRGKAHQIAHKTEKVMYDKAYRQKRKLELAASSKAYRQVHKEEVIERKKVYYQAHKIECTARVKAYQLAHPDKKTDYHARRRARKLGATTDKVSRASVYDRDGGKCHICGKKVDPKHWHLDHIIPLARGGEHSYRNVAVSCPKCNMRKHIKAGGQLRLL